MIDSNLYASSHREPWLSSRFEAFRKFFTQKGLLKNPVLQESLSGFCNIIPDLTYLTSGTQ
jgi:hypothetical protein